MKFNFSTLLALAFIMLALPMLGLQETPDTPGIDLSDPKTLVTYFIPFIVLGATWLFKKVFSNISGTYTLFVVTGLSALVAFLNSQLQDPDASWIVQFLLGLGSTFIHQLSRLFGSSEQ